MKKKLNNKQKLTAYVLNKDEELGYSMTEIGQLMKVSQSTISNSIKEVAINKKIYDLENELRKAKEKAQLEYGRQENNIKLIKPIRYIEEE